MFGRKRIAELEQLLTSVQMKESGKINEKTYRYYEHEGNKWQAKMKNYNHQNNVTGF